MDHDHCLGVVVLFSGEKRRKVNFELFWCRVSWRALTECLRTVGLEWMHLMVSLINCRKTSLPNIFDYDIRSSIVVIRVLVRSGRPFKRLKLHGTLEAPKLKIPKL